MATSSISSVRISGISAAVPKQKESISDCGCFDSASAERFSKQTGIVCRRVAPPEMSASDMCVAAAEKLIADIGWDKSEIEVLVYVSQSPDYLLPSTACILQDAIGLPKSCMAIEISYGCSGYVYGLSAIASMISSMRLRKGLLLVGEKTLSQHIPENRAFYPLFGDAGTATALEFDESAKPMFFDLCSDGSGKDVIIRRVGGIRRPFTVDSLKIIDLGGGIKMRPVDCYLDGAAIMEFCMREVKPSVARVLKLAERKIEDIDIFFAHQANRLINNTIAKLIKIPQEKVPYSLDEFANTSCASIPLTMVTRSSELLASKNTTSLLSGFGVGLSWGSAVVSTDCIKISELVEI